MRSISCSQRPPRGHPPATNSPSDNSPTPSTDNDRGNRSGYDRAAWFAAGRYAVVTDTSITQSDDGGLTAAYRYELADPDHTPVSVTYRVTPGMRMQLTVEYPGNATGAASLPAFGIEWELPGEYQHLRYYGTGPEETYRDRKQGGKLGIWDTTSEASTAPYLMVQETGSHEDVRWLEATDIQGHGLRIIQRGDRHFTAETTPGEPPSTRPTSCPPTGRSPST